MKTDIAPITGSFIFFLYYRRKKDYKDKIRLHKSNATTKKGELDTDTGSNGDLNKRSEDGRGFHKHL